MSPDASQNVLQSYFNNALANLVNIPQIVYSFIAEFPLIPTQECHYPAQICQLAIGGLPTATESCI